MKRILLVEDEHVILKALKRLLERNHYEVQCTSTVEDALAAQPHSFDLILADLRLPGDPGTALIPAAEPVPVIIMTSHASVRSAVDAMRYGAIDYIAKPFDHDELLLVIERSLQQNLMQSQNRALKMNMERLHPVQQHVEGTALEVILHTICQSDNSFRYLHLHGEFGTDKESLARAVHACAPYKDGPFLVLDVSADPSAAEKMLTGENSAQQAALNSDTAKATDLPSGGFLQAAQNGTLVIRYPELLSSDAQLSLCTAVASGVLVNNEKARQRSVNVALIGVSTLSIDTLVEQERLTKDFADLFFDHQFEVPPLRQRPQDIIPLARRHLTRLETRYASERMLLSEDAVAALLASDWPGNVSELESVLDRAVLQCRTKTITLTDLGLSSHAENGQQERDMSLDEYFRFFVIRNQTSLSETELAARLGISRKALWERRQKMNLSRDNNKGLSS